MKNKKNKGLLAHIVSFASKVYLWITSKLSKRMNEEKDYQLLSGWRDEIFASLRGHIEAEQEKGFLRLVPHTEENTVRYRIADHEFLLETDLRPFAGTIVFKTYSVTVDRNNYPNKKLEHLPGMDLKVEYSNSKDLRFVEPKTFAQNDIGPGVQPKLHPVGMIAFKSFGFEYMRQMLFHVQASELN